MSWNFLVSALQAFDSASTWDNASLERFGSAGGDGYPVFPPVPFQADIALTWSSWLLEALVPVGTEPSVATAYVQARRFIGEVDPGLSAQDAGEVARDLARVAYSMWKKSGAERRPISREEKSQLLAGSRPPHCWICGYRFSDWAIDRFLAGGSGLALPLPEYVDSYMPRTVIRDYAIEIDHVLPISGTGTNDPDNLRLACGWCNASKSDLHSLYDLGSGTWKRLNRPFPWWVVRLLGTAKTCMIQDCANTSAEEALAVVKILDDTAPVPCNLRVLCEDHDQYRSSRLIPRSKVPSVTGT